MRSSGPSFTLRRPVTYSGRGLHTGKNVTMKLLPAPPGYGIRFIRADLPGQPEIKANLGNLVERPRCSSLGVQGASVMMIEHLLAALYATKVLDCRVEVDALELPMGDGSALPFVNLLEEAGRVEQAGYGFSPLSIECPFWVSLGRKHMVALPCEEFKVSFTFVGDHPGVYTQYVEFRIDEETFRREIAPARTPAFAWEAEALREQGLGLGVNMDSCILLGEEGYLNDPRFPDEPVRHKVLDLIGDLVLAGGLCAHVIAIGSSHAMNHELARLIASKYRGQE